MGSCRFSSQFGLLSSNLLGAGIVDLLFVGEGLNAGFFSSSRKFAGLLGHLALFVAQPLFELGLGLLFGKGAFFDAVQEVVVVDHTLVLEDRTGRVAHLCTDLQPIEGAVVHDVNRCRVRVGIVGTDFLDKPTVALGAGIGCYNVVEGLAFLTVTLEAEACCHLKNVLEGSETPLLILVKWGAKIVRDQWLNNLFKQESESPPDVIEEFAAGSVLFEGSMVISGDG